MNDEKNQLALFKFSLIAPVVNNTYTEFSKAAYYRSMASKEHKLPSGETARYSADTIKKWYQAYMKKGFDTLIAKSRNDLGKPRSFDAQVSNRIFEIRGEFPYITGKLIHQKLMEEGLINLSSTSLSSVHRFLRENNLKRTTNNLECRAFEMEYANDCWQSDTTHAARIEIGGKKYKTYLISIIDDASRMLVHGQFFLNDNAVNMQTCLKRAIAKFGIPKKLFVDNGPSFKNSQLDIICASLGIVLARSRPYQPRGKGKIERIFRTIKDGWLNGIDWNQFDSLESINKGFNEYMSSNYTNKIHSSIETSPRERYLEDISRVKNIPTEVLEEHFLHRVTRKVNNDATISIDKRKYEVPQKYISHSVYIRYSPHDLNTAYIYDVNNKRCENIGIVKKVDNSKIVREILDYSRLSNPGAK